MKEDNLFIKLAESYYSPLCIDNIAASAKGFTTSSRKRLFKKIFPIYTIESLNSINDIKSDLLYLLDTNKPSFIYQFAKYVRYAEKCFMYRNDEDSTIYSEDIKDETLIYFNFKDYKVQISFKKTEVPAIGDLLFTTNSLDNNVIFVKIEIVRKFGKKMKNEIKKCILGEPDITFTDKSDEILYNNVISECTREILKVNDSILNSVIPFYTGINDDYYKDELLDWRKIKDDGLYAVYR